MSQTGNLTSEIGRWCDALKNPNVGTELCLKPATEYVVDGLRVDLCDDHAPVRRNPEDE